MRSSGSSSWQFTPSCFFLSHLFPSAAKSRGPKPSRPLVGHHGGAARSSPSGGSTLSLASQGRTDNSSKLWACARNAANAVRAVQLTSAQPPRPLWPTKRARASRRSSANAWLSPANLEPEHHQAGTSLPAWLELRVGAELARLGLPALASHRHRVVRNRRKADQNRVDCDLSLPPRAGGPWRRPRSSGRRWR